MYSSLHFFRESLVPILLPGFIFHHFPPPDTTVWVYIRTQRRHLHCLRSVITECQLLAWETFLGKHQHFCGYGTNDAWRETPDTQLHIKQRFPQPSKLLGENIATVPELLSSVEVPLNTRIVEASAQAVLCERVGLSWSEGRFSLRAIFSTHILVVWLENLHNSIVNSYCHKACNLLIELLWRSNNNNSYFSFGFPCPLFDTSCEVQGFPLYHGYFWLVIIMVNTNLSIVTAVVKILLIHIFFFA